jgi:beta-RFAP synthase
MIDRPRVIVELSAAEDWSATGPHAQRALRFARMSLAAAESPNIRAVRVEVIEAPVPHTGLGSGTQLALAVAAGVRELCGAPPTPIDELSASVDRGRRSAVGSYGFELGGLIWEIGWLPDETLGELRRRVEVPEAWRIVLAMFPHHQGLSGAEETGAFAQLPPVPPEVTKQLTLLAEEHILPAAESGGFDEFATAVYEYGCLAGSQFAAVQGGAFASPRIVAAVQRIRAEGASGVGQSSWGPTLFALAPNQAAAEGLIDRLEQADELTGAKLSVSRPDNQGARLEWVSRRTPVGYSKP